MASHRFIPLSVFSYLLVCYLTSCCSADEAEKVPMALYYETLCPGCSMFISTDLAKVVFDQDQDLNNIINLTLLPYGNAHFKNTTLICQHGLMECKLNKVEACAIHFLPNTQDHFHVIYCIEDIVRNGNNEKWESCLDRSESEQIKACAEDTLGEKLMQKYGEKTDKLQPPHQYVPWLVVDDEPIKDIRNFITYVCKAYKGTNLPKKCKEQFLGSIPEVKEKELHDVCYTKA